MQAGVLQLQTEKLQALSQQQQQSGTSPQGTDAGLVELRDEVAMLEQRLQEVERQGRVLQQDRRRLAEDRKQLGALEDEYWERQMAQEFVAQQRAEHEESIRYATHNALLRIRQLQRTNTYNDCFHIWHEGHFGTINGFRLGRLPAVPVDWAEINAAWGQATLLMDVIGRLLSRNKLWTGFAQFQPMPLGSSSKMLRVSDGVAFELYGSSELSFGKLFWYRRYDVALVGFLSCLQCAGEFCERVLDSHFRMPYLIHKDKIGELSIRTQFNNDEAWTRALKYLLTNLKWLLAFVHQAKLS